MGINQARHDKPPVQIDDFLGSVTRYRLFQRGDAAVRPDRDIEPRRLSGARLQHAPVAEKKRNAAQREILNRRTAPRSQTFAGKRPVTRIIVY